jgi:serine/threonine kinase 32
VLTIYRSAAAAVEGTVPEEHVELELNTTQGEQQQSTPTSPEGSPPLSPTMVATPPREENFPPLEDLKQSLPKGPPAHVRPASSSKSFSRPLPPQRPAAAQRQTSKSGGVQMVLDESGSWSNLADQTAPMPQDGGDGGKQEKSGGSMLGFLSRKKGRDRSPKPKEAGVLGKLGARHIIS